MVEATDQLDAFSRDRPLTGPIAVVVMGVTGSGKTTVGKLLAANTGWQFYDADDFHPPENVAKMRAGTPLTDEDRQPWLLRLRELIETELKAGRSLVLACSALRNAYRETLAAAGNVRFAWLKISEATAAARLAQRSGHFMPSSLVPSQFAALEYPQNAIVLDEAAPELIVADLERALTRI